MHHADPRFDDAGTFIGSSYVYAARELAKFGLLYLRDGVWDGARGFLPEGWVDHARTQRSWDPVDEAGYGAQWWTTGDELGTFHARRATRAGDRRSARRMTCWSCAWARPTPCTALIWPAGGRAWFGPPRPSSS